MTLWVDYTNPAGKREWREIADMSKPKWETYPPLEANYSGLRKTTLCIHVSMIDRDNAGRTLALTSIHGFSQQDTKPPAMRDAVAQLKDKIAILRSRIAELEEPANVKQAAEWSGLTLADAAKNPYDAVDIGDTIMLFFAKHTSVQINAAAIHALQDAVKKQLATYRPKMPRPDANDLLKDIETSRFRSMMTQINEMFGRLAARSTS